MWLRSLVIVSIFLIFAGAMVLMRQERQYSPTPPAVASRSDEITMTSIYAGGKPATALPDGVKTHEQFSASDVAEGKRLYHWFNCVTCHANGGGDIGPPLMDDKWLYGAEPRNIYASIVEGRPNGMPTFRGKIPDAQVWQLVAYIQSMGGHVPVYAKPGRNDDIQAKPPESMAPDEPVTPGGNPGPDRRSDIP